MRLVLNLDNIFHILSRPNPELNRLFGDGWSVDGECSVPRTVGHFIVQQATEIDTVDELAVVIESLRLETAAVPQSSRQVIGRRRQDVALVR